MLVQKRTKQIEPGTVFECRGGCGHPLLITEEVDVVRQSRNRQTSMQANQLGGEVCVIEIGRRKRPNGHACL
jgi:hypothetical protein